MTTIMAFIKRHAVLIYYVLTFAISWGSMLLVIGGPVGLPGTPEQIERQMGLVILALMAGPSVAGLLMTGLVDGRAGFCELRSRLFKWRVCVRWYAVALLTAPLLMTAILFVLSPLSSEFLPRIVTADDKAPLLLIAIVAGLGGGLMEELGWTGFVTPRLRLRYSVLVTGLIVGVVWGAWHFLVNFWASGSNSGGLSLLLFLPVYFFAGVAQLTAYRVLMVWVYEHTESLLVATLMHASLIVSTIVILAPVATGASFLTWFLALTVALWVEVAAVAVANGGQLSREPLRWRVA